MTRERFIELVRSEQIPLRRFLLALCCGDYNEADDIAQDTLVKVYLSADKYEEQGKMKAWLYRIAYNTFLDSKRSQRTMDTLEVLAEQSDDTFDADRNLRYQPLYKAMNELQPKERTVILLFYIQGCSVKEIAEIVCETEDAVKKQLSRGRTKLKTLALWSGSRPSDGYQCDDCPKEWLVPKRFPRTSTSWSFRLRSCMETYV